MNPSHGSSCLVSAEKKHLQMGCLMLAAMGSCYCYFCYFFSLSVTFWTTSLAQAQKLVKANTLLNGALMIKARSGHQISLQMIVNHHVVAEN